MNDALRQQALNLIQSADIASLVTIVQDLANALRPLRPDLPPFDVDASFVTRRKDFLHRDLEELERTDPTLAAQLQQVIDRYCTRFPFNYE